MTATQILTQEEMSVLSIYAEKTRSKVLDNLHTALPYIADNDIKKITERVTAKLMDMSDEDFSKLVISKED